MHLLLPSFILSFLRRLVLRLTSRMIARPLLSKSRGLKNPAHYQKMCMPIQVIRIASRKGSLVHHPPGSTVPFLKTPTTNCKREIVVKTEKLQKIAIPIRTFISTWFRDSCFSFSIECTLHLSVCLLIQKMYLFNLSIKRHSASDMLKIKPFFCFFSAI